VYIQELSSMTTPPHAPETRNMHASTDTAKLHTLYTPFTRYNRLSNRLNNWWLYNRHCTTDNRLNNRLHRVKNIQVVVKPVVKHDTTGLTTGCIVVKPVVSCERDLVVQAEQSVGCVWASVCQDNNLRPR